MEEMADEGISSLRFLLITVCPHWFTEHLLRAVCSCLFPLSNHITTFPTRHPAISVADGLNWISQSYLY